MNADERVNKVPASAGAQWLLDGMANLRKAPFAFGLLGVIYGAIALVVGQAATITTGLFMALEVLLVLLGPLLMGGFVFAARSVAAGGPAVPAQLLEGMHGGRTGRLLATLELRIVVRELLAATTSITLDPQQPAERAVSPVGGWARVPIVLT